MKINFNAGGFGNDGSPFGAGNPFGGSTFGGGGPFGFDFGNQAGGEEYQSQPSREPREAKSIKSPVKRTLVNLLTTLIIGAVYFYIVLPPINLKAPEFYSFVFLLCAVYCVMAVFTTGFQANTLKEYFKFIKKQCKIPFYCRCTAGDCDFGQYHVYGHFPCKLL